MNYIDTINGYSIYECGRKICVEKGYCYPTYAAFLNPEDNLKLGYEECSMETFDELAEWCEQN